MLFDLEEAIMFTPKPQEYTDPLTGEMKKKQIKFFPDVYFRCKDNNWVDFGMKEIIDRIPEGASQRLYISKDTDSYMQMFLRNYCLRPSCYECVAKEVKTSDLTIADFWGINNVVPEMNDGAGASLVLVRTNKGKSIFESIKMDVELKAVTYEESVKNNSAEFKSCDRPIQRNMFFGDMNGMSFEELAKKYAAPVDRTFKGKIKRKIKNIIKNMGGAEHKHNEEYGLLFVFRV